MNKMERNIGEHLGSSEITDFLVSIGVLKSLEGFCATYIVEKSFEIKEKEAFISQEEMEI